MKKKAKDTQTVADVAAGKKAEKEKEKETIGQKTTGLSVKVKTKTKAKAAKNLENTCQYLSLIERSLFSDNPLSDKVVAGLLKAKYTDEMAAKKTLFVEALIAFQEECPIIEKKEQGYDYKFAPISSIVSSVKHLFKKHGFAYHFVHDIEKAIGVGCVVEHTGGYSKTTFMYGDVDLTGSKNTIQGVGSTASYLERYTLKASFGIIVKGEDIDGEAEDYGQSYQQHAPEDSGGMPPYPDSEFTANFPIWEESISSGRNTTERILAMVATRGVLTHKQQTQVEAIESAPQGQVAE